MTLYNKKDTKTYSLIPAAHGSDMNHPPPPDSPKCCRADAPAVSHPDEWHVERTGMLIENIPPCVPSRCQSLVMPVVSGSRLSPRTAPGLRFHLWSFLLHPFPLRSGMTAKSGGETDQPPPESPHPKSRFFPSVRRIPPGYRSPLTQKNVFAPPPTTTGSLNHGTYRN